MRRLGFEQFVDDELHTFRYLSSGGRIVELSWPGLSEAWPEHGPNPMSEYAMNNCNREEIAIYLGLVWRLTSGFTVYATPRFHRADAMEAAGEPYSLIKWEYAVDSAEEAEPGQIRGFVRARSSVRISPKPSPWELQHQHEAALFEVPVFATFRDLVRSLLVDATAELNLYAVKRGRGRELAESLDVDERPRLAELIQHDEIFVDLVIDVDGSCDLLVIQSHTDISRKLSTFVGEYESGIERYEREVDQIGDMDTFLARIDKLMNLGDERDLARW